MIMDESVRGDYLSLNDATHNTTPFLKATDHLVNFGVAISGGNCSYHFKDDIPLWNAAIRFAKRVARGTEQADLLAVCSQGRI